MVFWARARAREWNYARCLFNGKIKALSSRRPMIVAGKKNYVKYALVAEMV